MKSEFCSCILFIYLFLSFFFFRDWSHFIWALLPEIEVMYVCMYMYVCAVYTQNGSHHYELAFILNVKL